MFAFFKIQHHFNEKTEINITQFEENKKQCSLSNASEFIIIHKEKNETNNFSYRNKFRG